MACITCPYNFFSEESERVQNYGCLPTPYEIIQLKKETGANWCCHYTNQETGLKICSGLIEYNERNKLNLDIQENQPKIDYNIYAQLGPNESITKAIIK